MVMRGRLNIATRDRAGGCGTGPTDIVNETATEYAPGLE
jgi:hypothetical protein